MCIRDSHPSIDDATLHLATVYYNLGDYENSFETIKHFLEYPIIDTNALPRLRALLFANIDMLESSKILGDFIIIKQIRNIPNCLYDKACIMPTSDDIEKLLKNKLAQSNFYLSKEEFYKLKQLLNFSKDDIIETAILNFAALDLLYSLSDIKYTDEIGICVNNDLPCNLNYKPLYDNNCLLYTSRCV